MAKNSRIDDEDIVTLVMANGKEVDFVQLAGIYYGNKFYAVMQPVEPIAGMVDNEVLIFEVTKLSDGQEKYVIEVDNDINEGVLQEYKRLLGGAGSGAGSSGSKMKSHGAHSGSSSATPAATKRAKFNKAVGWITLFLPLVLALALFITALAIDNSRNAVYVVCFVGSGVCFIWFVFSLIKRLIRKIRKH